MGTIQHVLAGAAALMVGTSIVGAATLNYSDIRMNSSGGGTFTTVSDSKDGDGSLNLTTPNASAKASVVFEVSYGTPLGNLGDLSSISLDFLKSSSPGLNGGNTAQSQFAYRILTNPYGNQALIWENQYNGNATVPTDSWQTVDIASGNYWQRANSVNFNGGSQAHPLSYYTAGNFEAGGLQLSPTTPVYGLEIAYGSGVGAFSGDIDNVVLTFGTGQNAVTYTGAVSAPEPTSMAAIGLCSAAFLRRRRQ